MEFAQLARDYVKKCGIIIPDIYLKDRIYSHPHYPSLVALTDTMDELNIDYEAVQLDKDMKTNVNIPILAHLISSYGDGDFVILNSIDDLVSGDKAIYEAWDGIIFCIPKGKPVLKPEIIEYQRKDKRKKNSYAIILSFLISILALPFFIYFEIYSFLFFSLTLIGVGLSVLLNMQAFGKHNIILDSICKQGDDSSCESVINSDKLRMFDKISLTDISIVYFLSLLFFLFNYQLSTNEIPVVQFLYLPTLLSIPIILLSLYYQSFVIKKWCKLCLFMSTLLLAQIIVNTLFFVSTQQYVFAKLLPIIISTQTISLIFSILIVSLFWAYFKSSLIKNEELKKSALELIKYKRDASGFILALGKQRQIDNAIWKDDIILGNPLAKTTIIVACNPYCMPCARAHKIFDQIISLYPEKVRIIIRFLVKVKNLENKKYIAANAILQKYHAAAPEIRHDVISSWFEIMDLEKWDKNRINNVTNVHHAILQSYENWGAGNKIYQTPTIFINGQEYPRKYSPDDLILFLPAIFEIDDNNKN